LTAARVACARALPHRILLTSSDFAQLPHTPQFDAVSRNEPARKKDPLLRKRLPNEAITAERSRDAAVLSSVLRGGALGEEDAGRTIHAPVPSAALQPRGRPGIRTQAPKKKPKGVFGVARDGPPREQARAKGGKGAGAGGGGARGGPLAARLSAKGGKKARR
jgi:hypothetical protein